MEGRIRVDTELDSVVIGCHNHNLAVTASGNDQTLSDRDSIDKFSVMLAGHLGAGVSIPGEELTSEAAGQGNVAIIRNTADAIVFTAEVAHTTFDVARIDRPLLKVFGTNRAEYFVVLPSNFNDVATISLGFSDAGTCISVVDSEVMIIAIVTNDQVLA